MDTVTIGNSCDTPMRVSLREKIFVFCFNFDMFQMSRKMKTTVLCSTPLFPIFLQFQCCKINNLMLMCFLIVRDICSG